MSGQTSRPDGAISYPEWLARQAAHPGEICGPAVTDDRAWWQHLPGLNPYAGLEHAVRQASRQARVQPQAEAEAG